MIIFAGLSGLFAIVYVGILRLRSDEEHSFVQLFKYGYPLSAIVALVGIGLLLMMMGRFEPFFILGMSFELRFVRLLSGVFISLGLFGCMGLLTVVGIGVDLHSAYRSGK